MLYIYKASLHNILMRDVQILSALAAAVAQAAMDSGVARILVDAHLVEQYCRNFIYEGINGFGARFEYLILMIYDDQ